MFWNQYIKLNIVANAAGIMTIKERTRAMSWCTWYTVSVFRSEITKETKAIEENMVYNNFPLAGIRTTYYIFQEPLCSKNNRTKNKLAKEITYIPCTTKVEEL